MENFYAYKKSILFNQKAYIIILFFTDFQLLELSIQERFNATSYFRSFTKYQAQNERDNFLRYTFYIDVHLQTKKTGIFPELPKEIIHFLDSLLFSYEMEGPLETKDIKKKVSFTLSKSWPITAESGENEGSSGAESFVLAEEKIRKSTTDKLPLYLDRLVAGESTLEYKKKLVHIYQKNVLQEEYLNTANTPVLAQLNLCFVETASYLRLLVAPSKQSVSQAIIFSLLYFGNIKLSEIPSLTKQDLTHILTYFSFKNYTFEEELLTYLTFETIEDYFSDATYLGFTITGKEKITVDALRKNLNNVLKRVSLSSGSSVLFVKNFTKKHLYFYTEHDFRINDV
jgi:hypothetical protein